jgi:hypothetical protein
MQDQIIDTAAQATTVVAETTADAASGALSFVRQHGIKAAIGTAAAIAVGFGAYKGYGKVREAMAKRKFEKALKAATEAGVEATVEQMKTAN